MHQLLIALFGKRYFRWQGLTQLKEERMIAALDMQVALDSIDELDKQLQMKQVARESETDTTVQHELAGHIDNLQEQRDMTIKKLSEHRQKAQNLDYKEHLLRNL